MPAHRTVARVGAPPVRGKGDLSHPFGSVQCRRTFFQPVTQRTPGSSGGRCMIRRITPKSSLDNLKREAKRWLHALRSGVAYILATRGATYGP